MSCTPSSSFSVITYQFDQMRLLIYYKSNDAITDTKNAVLKTFDLLSVKYRATGKAGLANKGGIVAEVKIKKTPNSLPVHKSGDERIRLITGSTDCQARVWSIEKSNTCKEEDSQYGIGLSRLRI